MTMTLKGWFSALARSKRLEPAWEYATRGFIWRLLPTEGSEFVGEERNTGEKAVSFFCIHQVTGNVRWAGIRVTEPWWTGIEAVHNGVVLLHEYAVPDFPDHRKIHALDLSSGRLLWTNERLKYLFAHQNGIFACDDRGDRTLYYELDGVSGVQRRELDIDELRTLRREVQSRQEEPIDFPAMFPAAGSADTDLDGLVRKLVGSDQARFIEYLEKGDVLALGYYAPAGKDPGGRLLDQHFIIADRNTGRPLYRDMLNSGAPAAVPDAFFGIGEHFYLIKDRKVLKAFNLPVRPTNDA